MELVPTSWPRLLLSPEPWPCQSLEATLITPHGALHQPSVPGRCKGSRGWQWRGRHPRPKGPGWLSAHTG